MDNFENYFKENRLRLDTEDIEQKCWQDIATSFQKHNRQKLFRGLYFAASIVLIIALASTIWMDKHSKNNEQIRTTILPNVYTNLTEQETSFQQVINIKMNKIKKQRIPVAYKSMFDDFIHQLQIIDQQYILYKKEVTEHGYSDELIQQIIYNYQLKISVLQMLQTEINKINNLSKSNENEHTNIQLNI